jgi:hypothetical protein
MTCDSLSATSHRRTHETHPLDSLVLPHELVCLLKSYPLDPLEVIAPTQHCHTPHLRRSPAREVVFSTARKVVAEDLDTITGRVELEQDGFAAKDEEVGVFSDDSVDETVQIEVGELSIRLVGCYNIL